VLRAATLASMDPLTVALGRVVAHRRRAAGLTWRTLGLKCGVSGNTVRNLELGVRSARIDIVRRIAGGLGVTVSELLREAEGRSTR
jgi:transcriptional regulator with XRE-family HTH domain